uniref:Putative conserved secreted protein n=1 Tax=Ixodes scapularis TaxID=6945 RepID=A0A4D5RFZ9_IXOSC
MRPLIVFALAVFAWTARTSPVLGLALQNEANEDQTIHEDPKGICKRVGSSLCGDLATCVALPAKDSFQCSCPKGGFYDANDKTCKHWQSCGPLPCKIGYCDDGNGSKKRHCKCGGIPGLTEFCKINKEAKFKCEEYGATAVLKGDEVTCDCGPAKKLINKKCVPVACLNFTMTCEELCQKKLLDKDDRCCQGWNIENCSKTPDETRYCKPGYISRNDSCVDACTAKVADPLCPNGCKSSATDLPFQCICKKGFQLAEDGITCTERRVCNEEEKKRCRKDQICGIVNDEVTCSCKSHQQEKDGVCTNECFVKKCSDPFANCEVYLGTEKCFCTRPLFPTRNITCGLEKYSYILTFRTNDTSPYSDDLCENKKEDIWKALKTLFGAQLVDDTLLSCKEDFVIRLAFSQKQDPAVLKRIETCQYFRGDVCIFPPRLYIKEGSAKLEEEDLCTEFFQKQLNKSNGMYVCQKVGDNYLFKCRDGLFSYNEVTSGRLTRWSCADKREDIPPASSESPKLVTDKEPQPGTEGNVTKNTPVPDVTDKEPQTGTEGAVTKTTPVSDDPCSPSPCVNGGVCKPGTGKTFTCECPKGFKGNLCEEKNSGVSVQAPVTAILGIAMSLLLLR